MRKKNLGKYTVSVLCAALVMSSLAGCANNSSSEDASTSSEADTSNEEDVAEDETENESDVEYDTDEDDMEVADGEAPDGEMPDGEAPDGEGMEMPDGEMPDGEGMEMPDGEMPDGEGMEMPDGEVPNGEGMEKPDGEAPDGEGMGDMGSMGGDMGGDMGGSSSSGVDSYTAVVEYTEDTTVAGETYTSTGTDENAIHIYGNAIVSITNAVVSRLSSDSTGGDNSSFYGVGAAVLATSGTAYISDSTIETDAAGGAGVFAYGDAVVYVADTSITTEQDTSGGIHAAGGGTLYAWDLDVETNGESAAAIRSDRGGGTMVVDGGSYTSNGTGSPAVYCTADIAINDATLTANGSEAVCIEGLNSLYIFDSDLTGNMSDSSQNDCTWNIILYQSMSGDSEVGNSTFQMVGGSITANNGGMFYTTNTESTFVLSDVDITYADDNEFFLRCTGNNNERGWGTSGSNGADCTFTAIDQEMEGDVIWDSISELDFYMTDGSSLTGAFLQDETYAGNGGNGYANLYIDDDSTWTVTGDSVLSGLYCTGTIVDADGNTVSIVGSDGTVYVDGDSEYTVTVDEYSESVDLSGASEISDWSEYEVEKPSELG